MCVGLVKGTVVALDSELSGKRQRHLAGHTADIDLEVILRRFISITAFDCSLIHVQNRDLILDGCAELIDVAHPEFIVGSRTRDISDLLDNLADIAQLLVGGCLAVLAVENVLDLRVIFKVGQGVKTLFTGRRGESLCVRRRC